MLNRENYKYIYNIKFANFLMIHGARCRGTGIGKLGKVFWAFDYDECQPIYDLINERTENSRVQKSTTK